MAEATAEAGKRKFSVPKIEKSDIMAGITTGIVNVPDGMGSAMLAGVNPVHGIYTLIAGTPLASMTLSTKLMMFNTTSAMTLVAVDGLGSRTGDDRAMALLVIALVAGAFQLILGLLGLGVLTKFVPHSVMTGFLTGISTLIIMGQLWDLTGYSDDLGGTKIEKTARLLANLGEVDPWTTAIGVGSIVLMVILGRTKLANFNLLIALAVGAIVTAIASPPTVELVSSLGGIPRSLPRFDIPELAMIPKMLIAGIAVASVGLLQAAGVAQAYPNPDGSPTSDSRDFMAQGMANISSSMFGGMAGGGSLSGTALHVGAGAKTRMAGVIQGLVVIVVVLVFSDALGYIPMAGLAALLIFAAFSSFKFEAIQTISHTSLTSVLSMVATFIATLLIPLQQAVMFGVVLAAVLFVYKASGDVRIQEITVIDNRLVTSDPPLILPANETTVLDVVGNLFYAGARTFGKMLPDANGVPRAVVVMRLRDQHDLGSTFFKVVEEYGTTIRKNGGQLILAGVEPEVVDRMTRTGLMEKLGPENVYTAGAVIGDSVMEAEKAGDAWLAAHPPAEEPAA